MSDYNLWKNAIQISKLPTSLMSVSVGGGFVATAVISGTTTTSSFRMSIWDAYLNLYEMLNNGERPIPKSTTAQAAALIGIEDGTPILNVTTNRFEICNAGVFQSGAGVGTMKPVSFGEMVEDNAAGSLINTTSKLWDSAGAGDMDANSLVTFETITNAKALKVSAGGAGTYQLHFSCSFTNAGGKLTFGGIHKNGSEVGKLEDSHDGDSSQIRDLRGQGFLILAASDEITLHVVSETASDQITVYHCHVTMKRIN